jgi:hypothetical protein
VGHSTRVQESEDGNQGGNEPARDRDSPPPAPGRVGVLELVQLRADPVEGGRPPEIA